MARDATADAVAADDAAPAAFARACRTGAATPDAAAADATAPTSAHPGACLSARSIPDAAAPGEASPARGLLAVLQLADSAFPAGLYAFSHGLETAAQEGHVRTAGELARFVSDWLAWQVGPGDAVLVAAAHRAAVAGDCQTVLDVDAYGIATKLAQEAREASARTGRRLLATAALLAPRDGPLQALRAAVLQNRSPGTYAAAFGTAAAALGAGEMETVLADLHGAAMSMFGAALRLLRVDHQQTQTILRQLAPLLARIAAAAVAQADHWRTLRPCAPFAEILQCRHEAAHVRLFMS